MANPANPAVEPLLPMLDNPNVRSFLDMISAAEGTTKHGYNTLFGGWEGNWVAFNTAHDLTLPNSKGDRIGFFMYPTAENNEGRLDSYAPDDFKYQISAKEIKTI